ncbi:MAG: sulfite exporter TauE/SafE family protein [Balneolaceae bacterium]|nr:sulfite exporter TauE/SafE family protein [Balneolaceae bacterium]
METWTALAIGFFGSFHCIGMCGPIALALPGQDSSTFRLITGRLLYNIGRIITYSLLGALFGLIGHSIVLAGLQQFLSIVLGIVIIITAISQNKHLGNWKTTMGLAPFFEKLKTVISAQFKKRGQRTLFTIGILNGLLPCGFVYIGLAGSVTTGSIAGGAVFMALFGFGTLPAMLAISLAPGMISVEMRRKINSVTPLLAGGLGLYLIYRGTML